MTRKRVAKISKKTCDTATAEKVITYNHVAKQVKTVAAAFVASLIPGIKSLIEQYKERQAQE